VKKWHLYKRLKIIYEVNLAQAKGVSNCRVPREGSIFFLWRYKLSFVAIAVNGANYV
jgi:hypothetical protein